MKYVINKMYTTTTSTTTTSTNTNNVRGNIKLADYIDFYLKQFEFKIKIFIIKVKNLLFKLS